MKLSPAPVLLLLSLSLMACGGPAKPKPKVLKNVFMILLENRNWDDIKSNPLAPYINDTLLPMAAYATNYSNPPNNHPSLPNYLWLEAAARTSASARTAIPANFIRARRSIWSRSSRAAGLSWKSVPGVTSTERPVRSPA